MKKNTILLAGLCLTGTAFIKAQDTNNSNGFTTAEVISQPDPKVTINQDPKIKMLLDIKTKLDETGVLSENYKVQLFYGNITKANEILNKATAAFPQWKSDIIWETPNYKVWIGTYRTRIEADRALKEIRTEFPNAFSFKPEKS
ncbi:SPOR domain-containing protein [Aquimarina addita]